MAKSKKSCKKGYSRSRATGRCKKIGFRNKLQKDVPEGQCRGRTKKSCITKVNCQYRKKTGCFKRKGTVKQGLVYQGPEMPDSGGIRVKLPNGSCIRGYKKNRSTGKCIRTTSLKRKDGSCRRGYVKNRSSGRCVKRASKRKSKRRSKRRSKRS